MSESDPSIEFHDPTNPRCLKCDKVLDRATPTEGTESPDEGSVSICMYCGHITIFTGQGLQIREPTAEEHEEMNADPHLQKVLNDVRFIKNRAASEGKAGLN